jgi:hypothetical protein
MPTGVLHFCTFYIGLMIVELSLKQLLFACYPSNHVSTSACYPDILSINLGRIVRHYWIPN